VAAVSSRAAWDKSSRFRSRPQIRALGLNTGARIPAKAPGRLLLRLPSRFPPAPAKRSFEFHLSSGSDGGFAMELAALSTR